MYKHQLRKMQTSALLALLMQMHETLVLSNIHVSPVSACGTLRVDYGGQSFTLNILAIDDPKEREKASNA